MIGLERASGIEILALQARSSKSLFLIRLAIGKWWVWRGHLELRNLILEGPLDPLGPCSLPRSCRSEPLGTQAPPGEGEAGVLRFPLIFQEILLKKKEEENA